MSLGQKIRIYRKQKCFTQSELAELLGVSVQAVSKWETDSGMPDIVQIIPLSRTLGISADVLLGNVEEDVDAVLSEISKIDTSSEFCSSVEKAREIYSIAKPCFDKYPMNSRLAYHCLESFALLLNSDYIDESEALTECNRYIRCIEKNETDTDFLFRSYYIMSKALRTLNEESEADAIINRIPDVFGDKLYWEAEVEYSNHNYDLAMQKCKESFATKARYVSRCIRLARQILQEKYGEKSAPEQFEYSRYMLRMIDAFLSGGNFISHRLAYQRITLLCGMVNECIKLNRFDEAVEYAYMVADTWKAFKNVTNNPGNHNSLMLPCEDDDGWWHITDEKFDEYWEITINRLSAVQQIKTSLDFKSLKNMFI